jgi:hypothetical protein
MTGGQATAKKVRNSQARAHCSLLSIKFIKFRIVWEIGNLEVAKTTSNFENKRNSKKCVSIMLPCRQPSCNAGLREI